MPATSPESSEVQVLYSPGLGETAMVFLVLALSASKNLFLSFLEGVWDIEGKEKLSALLLQIFKVGASIINNDAFPSNWLNVNVLAHKVLIKIMDPIATFLEREYVPHEHSGEQFDVNMWREAFNLLLKLLSSQHLVIEEFSPQVSICLPHIKHGPQVELYRNEELFGVLLVTLEGRVQQSYSDFGTL